MKKQRTVSLVFKDEQFQLIIKMNRLSTITFQDNGVVLFMEFKE